MTDQDNINDLKDAFNEHSVTDENGQIAETPATAEVPAEEQPTITDTEAPVKTKEEPREQETAETDPDVAEDEDGKKYVPKRRFDEVYAKWKEAERTKTAPSAPPTPVMSGINPDRSALLETEFLHQTLPQFNPSSPEYSEVLDEMGSEIYQSSYRFDPKTQSVQPTITKLEAARRALDRAKRLGGTQDKIRAEVRIVKSQQSDSGFTTASKKVADKKPEDMSLEEKEAYLKKTGQW